MARSGRRARVVGWIAIATASFAAASYGCSTGGYGKEVQYDAGNGAKVTATVSVAGTTFTPPAVTIHAGESVLFQWGDGPHNVVSGKDCKGDGKFTSGAPVYPPMNFEAKFTGAGTYEYFCSEHCAAGMKGQVVVQ